MPAYFLMKTELSSSLGPTLRYRGLSTNQFRLYTQPFRPAIDRSHPTVLSVESVGLAISQMRSRHPHHLPQQMVAK